MSTNKPLYGYQILAGGLQADLIPLMQLLYDLKVDIHLNGLYLLMSNLHTRVAVDNLTRYEYSWSDRTS